MKSRILGILSALALLSSCGSEEVFIPASDMMSIYQDLFYIDQCVDMVPEVRLSADSLIIYQPIIESYGYTCEQFIEAIAQYKRHPKQFARLMEGVRDDLREQKEDIFRVRRLMDSLKMMLTWVPSDGMDVTLPDDEPDGMPDGYEVADDDSTVVNMATEPVALFGADDFVQVKTTKEVVETEVVVKEEEEEVEQDAQSEVREIDLRPGKPAGPAEPQKPAKQQKQQERQKQKADKKRLEEKFKKK